MRLGIDFGTTRIVAAWVDRGNYPVVVFDAPDEVSFDWFPPLMAVRDDVRVYGWKAWEAQEQPGWTIVRSLKRALETAGPQTRVQIGDQVIPMERLLQEMVVALRKDLLEHSSLPTIAAGEPVEVMLGVPANANSNQRFLTAEAFRQAGFSVLGLLNEPSAASIEFGHRKRASQPKGKSRILIYDLGGGTFDVSLVELDGRMHSIIASEGISALGGDDFDGIMAELALDAAGMSHAERDSLSQAEMFRLHEECRRTKESLHPNTRNIVIDLGNFRAGWPQVSVTAAEFYERCRPLVEETVHATEDLLAANGYASDSFAAGAFSAAATDQRLEALYVTGGGSELPLVSRLLREAFGRRVRRSAYTRSATAMGLAIQADAQSGYQLRDRFTRYFGVWREAEAGRDVIFDPLFRKGAVLPDPSGPPLESSRRYIPVHNVGHFRFLECSHLSEDGRPIGDITLWDEIRFPFDPTLKDNREINRVPVTRLDSPAPGEVEENYSCDAGAGLTVTIANLSAGYNRRYRLGRWSHCESPIVPGRRKKSLPSRK